jgi:hypothetical protein
VLAASVNFKIKFVAFAFVDGREARPLNRADVHEGVGLSIIAHQKAKTLHGIEKLDCARDAFAGEFALGSGRSTRCHGNNVADYLKILRRNLAAAIDEVEFELLALGQPLKPGTFNRADVHEHILATGFLLNKAETLLGIEELDHAFAGADDLSGHTAETATGASTATSAAAWAAHTTTTWRTTATAEAITAAEPTAVISGALIAESPWRRKGIPTTKRIEAIFTEAVALVSAAPAPPIVTHKSIHTLSRRCSVLRQRWKAVSHFQRRATNAGSRINALSVRHSAQSGPLRIFLPRNGFFAEEGNGRVGAAMPTVRSGTCLIVRAR